MITSKQRDNAGITMLILTLHEGEAIKVPAVELPNSLALRENQPFRLS